MASALIVFLAIGARVAWLNSDVKDRVTEVIVHQKHVNAQYFSDRLTQSELLERARLVARLIEIAREGGGYGPSVGHRISSGQADALSTSRQPYILVTGYATCQTCRAFIDAFWPLAAAIGVELIYYASELEGSPTVADPPGVRTITYPQLEPLGMSPLGTIPFIPSVFLIRENVVQYSAHGAIIQTDMVQADIVRLLGSESNPASHLGPQEGSVPQIASTGRSSVVVNEAGLGDISTGVDVVFVFDDDCPQTPFVYDPLMESLRSAQPDIEVWVFVVGSDSAESVVEYTRTAFPWIHVSQVASVRHPRSMSDTADYASVVRPEVWYYRDGHFVTSLFGQLVGWQSVPGHLDAWAFAEASLQVANCVVMGDIDSLSGELTCEG